MALLPNLTDEQRMDYLRNLPDYMQPQKEEQPPPSIPALSAEPLAPSFGASITPQGWYTATRPEQDLPGSERMYDQWTMRDGVLPVYRDSKQGPPPGKMPTSFTPDPNSITDQFGNVKTGMQLLVERKPKNGYGSKAEGNGSLMQAIMDSMNAEGKQPFGGDSQEFQTRWKNGLAFVPNVLAEPIKWQMEKTEDGKVIAIDPRDPHNKIMVHEPAAFTLPDSMGGGGQAPTQQPAGEGTPKGQEPPPSSSDEYQARITQIEQSISQVMASNMPDKQKTRYIQMLEAKRRTLNSITPKEMRPRNLQQTQLVDQEGFPLVIDPQSNELMRAGGGRAKGNPVLAGTQPQGNAPVGAPMPNKPIPATELTTIAGFDTVQQQLANVRKLAKPEYIGLLDAPIGEVERKLGVGKTQEYSEFKSSLANTQNQLVYLFSGKQINEKEFDRLMKALPTDATSWTDFQGRVAVFDKMMTASKKNKLTTLKSAGYRVTQDMQGGDQPEGGTRMIRVISPSGKTGSIPESKLADAKKAGFKVTGE